MSQTASAKTILTGIAMAVLAAVCLAMALVLSRLTYDVGVNALSILFLRFTLFTPVLGGWLLLKGQALRLPRQRMLTSFGVGLLYVAGFGAYLGSVAYLPVSLAVLIFYTYPLVTVIMASILDQRRPSLQECLGFAAAFIGIALALQVSFESLHPFGIGLTVFASVCIALSFVLSARALKDTDTTLVTLYMAISSLLVTTLIILLSGALGLPSETTGWAILLAALAVFAVGFLAMFQSVKLIGPVRSAMVMNLEPPATILLAIVILGEHMSTQQVLGAALVIGAIVFTQSRS